MYMEVQKRVLTLTDNRYLNSYLTSMNCVRGKEHNKYLNSYLTSMNCVRGKEHNYSLKPQGKWNRSSAIRLSKIELFCKQKQNSTY